MNVYDKIRIIIQQKYSWAPIKKFSSKNKYNEQGFSLDSSQHMTEKPYLI